MAENTPTTFTESGAKRVIDAVRTVEGSPHPELGPKMPYHFTTGDGSIPVFSNSLSAIPAGSVGYVGGTTSASTTPHFIPGYPWRMGWSGREDYYRNLPPAIVVDDIPAWTPGSSFSSGRVWTTGIHPMRVDASIWATVFMGDLLGRVGFSADAGWSPYPDFVVCDNPGFGYSSPYVLANILQQPYQFRMARSASPLSTFRERSLCRVTGESDGFLLVDSWDDYSSEAPAVAQRWISSVHPAPIIQSGAAIVSLGIPYAGDYVEGRAIPDDLGRVVFKKRISATEALVELLPEDRGGVLVQVTNHPELTGYYKTIEFDRAYWSVTYAGAYGSYLVTPR